MEEKIYVPTAKDLHDKATFVSLIQAAERRKDILSQCDKAADEGKFEYTYHNCLTPADVKWFRDRGFRVYNSDATTYCIRWDEVEED